VKWVLAPVAVLWALGWGYVQINYPTCTFRYKLTAEVMTPDGLKTGSSVVEVGYYSAPIILRDGAHVFSTAIGEATYVDLGEGKNLFILMSNRESGRNGQFDGAHADFSDAKGPLHATSLPIKIFGLVWQYKRERQLCREFAVASANANLAIPFGSLPTLVNFNDINDPRTVKVVQPDQFETDYGAGYKFLGTKIEATNEVPTNHIEGVLNWLPDKKPKDKSISWSISDQLIDQLNYTSFKQPM
jgi:hypothetical protein